MSEKRKALSIYPAPELREKLESLAQQESRPVANMALVLIERGIERTERRQ